MKHLKIYENINYPKENNYIVYKIKENKEYYYILKILSINDHEIILKPIWKYDLIKYINDDRSWITCSLNIDLLLNNIIYFSNKLKNVRNFCNMLKNINKYNL